VAVFTPIGEAQSAAVILGTHQKGHRWQISAHLVKTIFCIQLTWLKDFEENVTLYIGNKVYISKLFRQA